MSLDDFPSKSTSSDLQASSNSQTSEAPLPPEQIPALLPPSPNTSIERLSWKENLESAVRAVTQQLKIPHPLPRGLYEFGIKKALESSACLGSVYEATESGPTPITTSSMPGPVPTGFHGSRSLFPLSRGNARAVVVRRSVLQRPKGASPSVPITSTAEDSASSCTAPTSPTDAVRTSPSFFKQGIEAGLGQLELTYAFGDAFRRQRQQSNEYVAAISESRTVLQNLETYLDAKEGMGTPNVRATMYADASLLRVRRIHQLIRQKLRESEEMASQVSMKLRKVIDNGLKSDDPPNKMMNTISGEVDDYEVDADEEDIDVDEKEEVEEEDEEEGEKPLVRRLSKTGKIPTPFMPTYYRIRFNQNLSSETK